MNVAARGNGLLSDIPVRVGTGLQAATGLGRRTRPTVPPNGRIALLPGMGVIARGN